MTRPLSAPLKTGSGTSYCWSLIGSGTEHLKPEYSAGIRIKTVSLSWKKMFPAEGVSDSGYVDRKLDELSRIRKAGYGVILLLGYYDTPTWLHDKYPDSHYINQYGDLYTGSDDAGDANLVFNPALRELVDQYIQYVFSVLGTDFAAVRVGGGRYGELTYPPADFAGKSNNYWAFDRNSQAKSPVPGWRPGDPSPGGEAAKFLNFYLDALVDFQNWQIKTVRKSYAGPLMVLYPSWGMRPGDGQAAIQGNLNGRTSAERNGEVQRGFDFARQVASIDDPLAILTTTWLDADASGDGGADPRYWSPVKYLASLASQHPLTPPLFGENTGQGTRAVMEFSAAQMERFGLIGMAWYNETELLSGRHASLQDYRQVIEKYSQPGPMDTTNKTYLPVLQSK